MHGTSGSVSSAVYVSGIGVRFSLTASHLVFVWPSVHLSNSPQHTFPLCPPRLSLPFCQTYLDTHYTGKIGSGIMGLTALGVQETARIDCFTQIIFQYGKPEAEHGPWETTGSLPCLYAVDILCSVNMFLRTFLCFNVWLVMNSGAMRNSRLGSRTSYLNCNR